MRPFTLFLLAVVLFAPASLHAGDYRLLALDGRILKWGEPEFGRAGEVTYGFVARPRGFEDAVNCGQLAPMEPTLSRWSIAPEAFDEAVTQAFAIWARAAGLRFREAGPDEDADILIGAQAEPRGIAFANVWYDANKAANGLAPLTQALICLNPEKPWRLPEESGGTGYDLQAVIAHEIGHAIGLDHPGPSGQLMGYSYQEDITGLMPGDIAGAVRLYGAP